MSRNKTEYVPYGVTWDQAFTVLQRHEKEKEMRERTGKTNAACHICGSRRSQLNEILNRFENGGRVYLREDDAAELLGIAKGTLQEMRRKGVGPRVFRKKGYHKTQPKTMMHVYSIPDLIVWYQAYIVGPLLKSITNQISKMERGIFRSIKKHRIKVRWFHTVRLA